eukprot:TRINITY_DN7268_c3_g1_i1.p1 TRINITY_DN7268_c3_g1~~TRINITY_DN7268_c3_g1_i1.p1  ORF type:complete len:956 (-),score=207.10 TRINITY_DN7268_c3_g1_i1:143-2755(-)
MAENVEDDDQLRAIFGPLLTQACQKIVGRNLVDQKVQELGWITAICTSKGPLAKLLVKLPIFRPTQAPPAVPNIFAMMQGGASGSRGPVQPGLGYKIQMESLLGLALSPTCLDTGVHKEKSARHIHFQGLSRKSRGAVQQVQSLLRHSMQEVMRQASAIIAPLLRTDEATRQAVLDWYGALITGTEARTKSSNTLDEGGGPNHFLQTMSESPMPAHQNLDMRLQMQATQAQMMGFCTPGMGVNAFVSLLELVRPIKLAQAANLDPFYILRTGPSHETVLGNFAKEARFGDSDEVTAATEYAKSKNFLAENPKFTVQIFWLALRGLHILYVPVVKEELCFAVGAGYFQGRDMAKMEACLGEHFLHETIMDSSSFLSDLATLLNLSMAFVLSAAFPDKAAEFSSGTVKGSLLTEEVSPQWSVLPSCLLEDLIEVLEYCSNIRAQGQPPSEIFMHLDPKLLLYIVTFMLGNGNHMKNPNLRGKATTVLMSLAKQPNFRHILETSEVLANDIIPGCIRVFTAVEKTKQSYYDTRMQLKYQLRIPIMELFEQMMPLEAHKKSLQNFAANRSDEFLKFLNQMMNDATMQLEEGLDTLTEIRRIIKEKGEAGLQRPSGEALEQDEQNADGQDVYARSRADPKAHCKQYMSMGHRTIRTLWSISGQATSVITNKLNVLQQLLHNCLNACLDRLVGPRCLELKMQKGQANDFEEYNFKPKELLQMIAEMYVFVGRADKEKVQKMITDDGRSYRPKTFQKAVSILKREMMISPQLLKEFETFVQELNELAANQEAALANVDIPDEFLDPIMSEIMVDPVLLPTSQNIMDRRVIERHIMSNDDDPFNRAHLSVEDLVPQDELRERIHAFCTKHGISLGGED